MTGSSDVCSSDLEALLELEFEAVFEEVFEVFEVVLEVEDEDNRLAFGPSNALIVAILSAIPKNSSMLRDRRT